MLIGIVYLAVSYFSSDIIKVFYSASQNLQLKKYFHASHHDHFYIPLHKATECMLLEVKD